MKKKTQNEAMKKKLHSCFKMLLGIRKLTYGLKLGK